MPPTGDSPSHPMLKVYQDIGKITTGISNLERGQGRLEEGQQEVEQKISGLHQTVAHLVTTEDCEAHRAELAAEMAGEAEDAPTSNFPPKPGLLARMAGNAGDITKILSLVAAVVIGLWAVHKFVVRVESALVRTGAQQTKATKKLMHRLDTPAPPQVVYVPVTIKPDAGVRRRRRPRRRPRRLPAKRATP